MPTFKEIVNKHLTEEQKQFFAKVFKFETPIITPDNATVTQNAQDTTADGTVVKSDSPQFVVGSVVTVVTPEGEMPVPDGEITLSTGQVLTIANGLVTEVETPTADIAPGSESPAQTGVTPQQMADLKSEYDKKLEESAKIISALVSRFNAVESDNKELKTKVETFSAEFAKLMDLPIGEPIATEQTFNSKKEKAVSIFKK